MLLQRKHQTSILHMFVVFCKPILAMLLQRKHQTSILHMFVVFCKPILAMLLQRSRISHVCCVTNLCFVNPFLQCCYKENIRRASCISRRGTRDYGMYDVNKASQCEHQAIFKIVISHSVVACYPDLAFPWGVCCVL